MHPRRPWIVVGTLVAIAAQAAVVYKWTDANGVVHFSDQPAPGSEKMVTSGAQNSYKGSRGASLAPPQLGQTSTGVTYAVFKVTSPSQDQTFFNDDVVSVTLGLEPALKPGHSITWHLNGKEMSDIGPGTTQFVLPQQARGTYVIAATITDQNTGESASSDSVTFFVRQPTELSPQHKAP